MPDVWDWAKAKKRSTNKIDQTGVPDGHKRCGTCSDIKPVDKDPKKSGFYKQSKSYDGFASQCKTCQAEFRTKRDRSAEYDTRRLRNGYTVVDGMDYLQDGAHLDYYEVHNKFSKWSFPDGAVLRRNRDGKLFEVYNRPILMELED